MYLKLFIIQILLLYLFLIVTCNNINLGWLNEDDKKSKILSYKVKLTTRLQGSKKNAFMLDMIKRDWTEAELIRQIISLHYDNLELNNIQRSTDFKEIRDVLIRKNRPTNQ